MNSLKNFSQYKKLTLESAALMIIGNALFAFALNGIIVPLNLYSGGFTGVSQLLKYLFVNKMGLSSSLMGLDMLGIIYFILNIPLFIFAYKIVGREFCLTSLVSIGIQSLLVSVMPIPAVPVIKDTLTACLVGGVLCGMGCGLVLRSGSSGGGNDIIGVCLAKIYPNIHVGVIAIIMNIFILGACFFLFDIEVVIYSMIYAVFMNIFLDRMHTQNINMQAMIFTKVPHMADAILNGLGRGVTNWDGAGAYTGETSHILVTVISKYEISRLLDIVKGVDPNCFVITTEGASIYGNFTKRLTTEELRDAIKGQAK